jgi:hypothetical protein
MTSAFFVNCVIAYFTCSVAGATGACSVVEGAKVPLSVEVCSGAGAAGALHPERRTANTNKEAMILSISNLISFRIWNKSKYISF